jgi:hypothetical protein
VKTQESHVENTFIWVKSSTTEQCCSPKERERERERERETAKKIHFHKKLYKRGKKRGVMLYVSDQRHKINMSGGREGSSKTEQLLYKIEALFLPFFLLLSLEKSRAFPEKAETRKETATMGKNEIPAEIKQHANSLL